VILGLFRRMRLRRLLAKLQQDRPVMHLPDDLADPGSVAVFCAGGEEGVWAALYMARALAQRYGPGSVEAYCNGRDRELMASEVPGERIHPIPDPAGGEAADGEAPSMVFYPYSELPLETAVSLASLRRPVVGLAEHPTVGLRVRIAGGYRLPGVLEEMCRLLELPFPSDWRPEIPRNDSARAEALLAPVSGHAMPYISASSAAAEILRSSGLEIPLKMVIMDSEKGPVAGAARGVRAAVVGGSSAVVTDDPVVWSDACALGVPAVGLDRKGVFPPWGGRPAEDEQSFIEAWRELLREGW
jgi:hypothetical protein